MADFYENYAENHLKRISTSKTYLHKQQAFIENYRDVLPADRAARILELGPGLGEVADLLIGKLGYLNYLGIDISKDIVALFSDRCEIEVRQVEDPAAFLAGNSEQYDVVILLHVLEHVPKPLVIPLLRAIQGSLKPTGVLIVEVPNVANAFIGGGFAFGDFTHETAFTSTSLLEVLGAAGFPAAEVRPVRVPRVSAARWLQHLLQRLLNGTQRLLARVYMPSGTPLFSHFIAAVGRKQQ